MKRYQVTKVNSVSGKETNYGINYEEDMKLITRGYKKDELIPDFYNRENSKYFFVVTEVKDVF